MVVYAPTGGNIGIHSPTAGTGPGIGCVAFANGRHGGRPLQGACMLWLMSAEGTYDALRAKITTWLLGEGWQISEKPHGDALWLLEASDSQGRHVAVGQRRGKPEQILLEAAVGLSEHHQQRFSELAPAARQELLWELRFGLLALGVDFHGAQEPLQRVVIGHRIYEDGLTRDLFAQRLFQVRNALLTVLWTVARRLDSGNGPDNGDIGVN
jgi:hypothetical protein